MSAAQVSWDEPQSPQVKWDDEQKPAQKEPGFLDKDIPLSGSLLNPTLSGIQSIGRGVRSAVRGIGDTLDPSVHPGEELTAGDPRGYIARPIARMVMGASDTAKMIPEIPGAIHDINQSPDPLGHYAKAAQDTAGEGAGQALTALATEGAVKGMAAIPKSIAAAPVRMGARAAEGVANSTPLRALRSAARLGTPADEAMAPLKIPGRDLGLEKPGVYPGANLPENPIARISATADKKTLIGKLQDAQSRSDQMENPRYPGAPNPIAPENVPVRSKLGGRLILTPEELEQAEQIQKVARKRASERGMQYAAGMKPSGGKIAAP